jgi:hypothetical protein
MEVDNRLLLLIYVVFHGKRDWDFSVIEEQR